MLCYEYNLVYGVIVYSTHTHTRTFTACIRTERCLFFFGWQWFLFHYWVDIILHVKVIFPHFKYGLLCSYSCFPTPPILNHDYKSYVHNNNNNTLLSLYRPLNLHPTSTPSSNASASIGLIPLPSVHQYFHWRVWLFKLWSAWYARERGGRRVKYSTVRSLVSTHQLVILNQQ